MRLKETPGGLPATPGRRLSAALAMFLTASGFSFVILCQFSSQPIVNDYPKLKLMAPFSERSAYFSRLAEEQTPASYFLLGSLALGLLVGGLIWVQSDPKKRKLIVERGQSINSDKAAAILSQQTRRYLKEK